MAILTGYQNPNHVKALLSGVLCTFLSGSAIMKSRYLSSAVLSILLLCVPLADLAAKPKPPSVEDRVQALEELILQQQGQIGQNTADIQALQGQGDGARWVVMDSDDPPKIIGETYPTANNSLIVKFEIDGLSNFIQVTPSGIAGGNNSPLYFSGTDCTGTPYSTYYHTYSTPAFVDTFLIAAGPGNPNQHRPYRPSGPAVPYVEIQSTFDSDGFCNNHDDGGGLFEHYPMEAFGDDLHVLYPPPYTLVEQ
jgi:hypothetical protein